MGELAEPFQISFKEVADWVEHYRNFWEQTLDSLRRIFAHHRGEGGEAPRALRTALQNCAYWTKPLARVK